ncbi:SpoIIE family protein phosphatase [Quadrisphaera sp. INWT6]|uniref:PP2C family protein-serine/threonine phosphatase n=1 Tax=Quadrisphaera sp. INWT6 TaxID=2596917 RepID=UPI0019D64301
MVLHADGRVDLLEVDAPDLLLGYDPASRRQEAVVVVERGATVLLYTDGLVEQRAQSLDTGLGRLRALLSELGSRPLPELCDALLEQLVPSRPEDDVALVAVRLHPQDGPRPAGAAPALVPPGVPPEPAATP